MKLDSEAICELMRACGKSITDIDRSTLQIDAKAGHANFVTDCDRKVQERLRRSTCASSQPDGQSSFSSSRFRPGTTRPAR